MKIELSKKQAKAWRALESLKPTESGVPVNYVLYGGGAGGGKSYLGCVWQIYRRITYPETRGVIARHSLKAIRESVLQTFFSVCRSMGISKSIKYNATDMHVTFPNGSMIFFKEIAYNPSDPDFQNLGSLEITDAFIEECATVPEKGFEVLTSRIRHKNSELGISTAVLLTCNPGPHWAKYRFIKDKNGNPVNLKPTDSFIPALLSDNPDPKFVEQYKALLMTKSEYEKVRLLYGDWDAEERTGGEFYQAFDANKHVVSACPYDPSKFLHFTYDFNVIPYLSIQAWQVAGSTIYLLKEVTAEHPINNTQDATKKMLSYFPEQTAHILIYGDPSGRSRSTKTKAGENDYTIITGTIKPHPFSLRVAKKAPPLSTRGLFINNLFANKIGNWKIQINSECVHSIRDFQNVKENAEGGKRKDKVTDAKGTYEPIGHLSDAFDYFICELLKTEFLKFQKTGKLWQNLEEKN